MPNRKTHGKIQGGQHEEASTAAHTGGPLRTSVQRRQDVDLSVSAQLRALNDYARANGYSVAREYVDEAESGRVADRPQFREMIEEDSQPKAPFEVILVWKFSRFTRKREHAVAFKSMLRRKGRPGGVHHRACRRLPHRQADGGHHRERGRVLLGKSRARTLCGG